MAREVLCSITTNNGATVVQLVTDDLGLAITTLRVRNASTRPVDVTTRGLTTRQERVDAATAEKDLDITLLAVRMDQAMLSLTPVAER